MMTLMPVAAFAAAPVWDASAVYTVDTNAEANVKEKVRLEFALNDADGAAATTDSAVDMYIWATVNGSTAASSALVVENATVDTSIVNNTAVWKLNSQIVNGAQPEVSFKRAGTYTIHASMVAPTVEATTLKVTAPQALRTEANKNTVVVTEKSVNPDTNYLMAVNGGKKVTNDETVGLGENLIPNNVANEVKVNFFLKDADGKEKALVGKTVAIETGSSSITVDKASATTGVSGNIEFNVAASHEGKYKVYLTVDGVTFTIEVQVGNTAAAYIETIVEPVNPKALWGTLPTVRFQVTDINGNIVKGINVNDKGIGEVDPTQGMKGIANNVNGTTDIKKGTYIVLTEAPAASKIESADFSLVWNNNKQAYDLRCGEIMDAEGTYAVKVILDNGAYATATWEVKKFATPVTLRIDYPTTTVELGASITPDQIVYVDENKVEKDASKDVEFAAAGYAVYDLSADNITATNMPVITVKTDEKYVGSKIDVTAVSDRYNLVANVELTVADEARDIAFATKTADVNVNNKILWNVVDAQGNKVALAGGVIDTTIKYVVLDKPADAKVSVYDATNSADLAKKGEGKMALTSNKVGNVTVQAVVKATYKVTDKNQDAEKTQVKYYTGTQIFAVGTGSVGDVVVMSIGSNEIIVNDAKATIDAAPMVQNDRTYVPFRALAEAFGAEVAYDEATQAVTAELNGVTVVMTIGSATYTVNGEEKTMDVAPFINGSRTMVPVRFAAEAFGIKVIPTYDENGATADILFNL